VRTSDIIIVPVGTERPRAYVELPPAMGDIYVQNGATRFTCHSHAEERITGAGLHAANAVAIYQPATLPNLRQCDRIGADETVEVPDSERLARRVPDRAVLASATASAINPGWTRSRRYTDAESSRAA
jgi:hypothetical protein